MTDLMSEIQAMRTELSEVRAMLLHLIDALAEEHIDCDTQVITDLDGRSVVMPVSPAANGSLDDA